ncbi:LLM class flavin-dependent oxidoreductase [Marinitenerispora sediminis]|uniref:LLM class flavin-dependent oxidoreductase n=1 Tax=Marinitenerispora sediminis TaxID=1931232 RepID=A0A368TBH0_9ACTN|nr:LLM class flavin-dependent oxidoreductase [Marinitenerispora sediminis]RCV50105.1 LLM class flavin-dependent oxidoreductase [Marinitenerispora sediminis]RCV54474.1 LLM class flavin-dependent oxidoreductase [Marinitenerispora sediminis]RCV62504.1 LLM class flavin-dependent oxidoreductase [Marinitenerispora sediminis]
MAAAADVPLSILDLATIVSGATAADALRNTTELARRAEERGYRRFWLAEHHNMAGVASSATAVLIGHVAGATRRIRVGSGGVMLPNHAPLVVAEQFGTLATLYPDRIDLGLGRAPGTDPWTTHALWRGRTEHDDFPAQVEELRRYLAPATPTQRVRAVPGQGTEVPVWILGSSMFGAALAAQLGLPYAFASHFAPDLLHDALTHYRDNFRPSAALERPYAMAGVNVLVAEDAAEARRQFTSVQQRFLALARGGPQQLQPPKDDMAAVWSEAERRMADAKLSASVVGDPATVRRGLAEFVERTGVSELMVVTETYDFADRLRSYELLADLWN